MNNHEIGGKETKTTNNDGWFVDDEERYFKGSDFSTKHEDFYKLIRHFKQYYGGKGDFYRYLTPANKKDKLKPTDKTSEPPVIVAGSPGVKGAEKSTLIQSMIFSSEFMKEQYHLHRDIMFVCPFTKSRNDNRFGMMGLMLYGVNSYGKNQVYAMGFINPEQSQELENYEFIFS